MKLSVKAFAFTAGLIWGGGILAVSLVNLAAPTTQARADGVRICTGGVPMKLSVKAFAFTAGLIWGGGILSG